MTDDEPTDDEPTDLDLIVGHPFQGTGRWGDICEHESGGWICGFGVVEHERH
jgi:hypothetical protein